MLRFNAFSSGPSTGAGASTEYAGFGSSGGRAKSAKPGGNGVWRLTDSFNRTAGITDAGEYDGEFGKDVAGGIDEKPNR